MQKKEYFVELRGEKSGPFTFDELTQKDVFDNTLVWRNGWDDWKLASNVEELQEFIIKTPPPTPSEKKIVERKQSFDDVINFLRLKASTFLMIFASLTILINVITYEMIFLNIPESNLHPIYLTQEQQDNPKTFFFDQLPVSALIALILTSIFLLFSFFLYKPSTSPKSSEDIKRSANKSILFSYPAQVYRSAILLGLYGIFGPCLVFTSLELVNRNFELTSLFWLASAAIITYFGFKSFKKTFEAKVVIIATTIMTFFLSFFLISILGLFAEFDELGPSISSVLMIVSIVLFFIGCNYLNKNLHNENAHDDLSHDGNNYGRKIFDDGSIYEGELKNGMMHGYGKYTFATGEFLIANFVENKIEGIATSHFPDGSTRQIEYKDDKIIKYID